MANVDAQDVVVKLEVLTQLIKDHLKAYDRDRFEFRQAVESQGKEIHELQLWRAHFQGWMFGAAAAGGGLGSIVVTFILKAAGIL